jgi:hypothetical protein
MLGYLLIITSEMKDLYQVNLMVEMSHKMQQWYRSCKEPFFEYKYINGLVYLL